MDPTRRAHFAHELLHAEASRTPIPPLSAGHDAFTVDDAYAVQSEIIAVKREQGAVVIGRKIGLTSRPIQSLLGVHEPDFGQLLSTMHVHEREAVPVSRLIQPKAEGEIAFVMERDLDGAHVTEADVLRCTAYVSPAIEIIDSRIADWKITITDTVADNASSALFAIGGTKTSVTNLDLRTLGMALEHNGSVAVTGAGAAALGNPVTAVAWLANALRSHGDMLRAGDIVLSGALAGTVIPHPGDTVRVSIRHLGSVTVRFAS
jgi:2-oxopent-4-enoate hydratase